MTHLARLQHWFRVTFRNACPDPECPGHMVMYDSNPKRDSCDVCGKSERDFEDKKRIVA